MAAKKSTWVLLGILVISAWVLASVTHAGAETLKGRDISTATKTETISVNDEEGHFLAVQLFEGLAVFENGEIAKTRSHSIIDGIRGKGIQSTGYIIWTFEDGSTVITRVQRSMVPDQSGKVSAKVTSDIIKGTGRFEGIKGTGVATGVKIFPSSKAEASRAISDFTWTYTLPTK